MGENLTLKEPITTAADDKFCDIFSNFRKEEGIILHENRLPADDSHEISYLICYLEKAAKFETVVCCKKIGGALRINNLPGHKER